MAEPETVDALDGGDVLHHLETPLGLDVGDDEVAGVGRLHLGGGIAWLVVVVREAEGGAAPALGG